VEAELFSYKISTLTTKNKLNNLIHSTWKGMKTIFKRRKLVGKGARRLIAYKTQKQKQHKQLSPKQND